MGQTISSIFASEPLSGSERDEIRKLEFADACLAKANNARDLGDFLGSLGWLEQSLLVRAEVLGASLTVNYNHAYIANLISIGETHLSLRRFDQALVYFFRAKSVLDPLVLLPSTKHTSAATQYVNLTAGLALVLTAVAKNHHKATYNLLEGADPLRVAEQQLEQAVVRVVALEGARAPLLVSLYHILTRVYLMTNKRMAALRVMQRCLGLTLQISQTKKIFSFLSYTRNVLDTIKELTLVERVVIKIQQWYRDKVARRQAEEIKNQMLTFNLTVQEVEDAFRREDEEVQKEYENTNNGNNLNNDNAAAPPRRESTNLLLPNNNENDNQQGSQRQDVLRKFAKSVRRLSDARMVASYFAAAAAQQPNNDDQAHQHHQASNFFFDGSTRNNNTNSTFLNSNFLRETSNLSSNNPNSALQSPVNNNNNNNNIRAAKEADMRQKKFSMLLQHQRSMKHDRSHLVSPILMHASMMEELGPAAARSFAEQNSSYASPEMRRRSNTFSRAPVNINLAASTIGAKNNINQQQQKKTSAGPLHHSINMANLFVNSSGDPNSNSTKIITLHSPKNDNDQQQKAPSPLSIQSLGQNSPAIRISDENSPFAKLQAFKEKQRQQQQQQKSQRHHNDNAASASNRSESINFDDYANQNLPHAVVPINDSNRHHRFDDNDDPDREEADESSTVPPLLRKQTQVSSSFVPAHERKQDQQHHSNHNNSSATVDDDSSHQTSYSRQDNELHRHPRDQERSSKVDLNDDDENDDNRKGHHHTTTGSQGSFFGGTTFSKDDTNHDDDNVHQNENETIELNNTYSNNATHQSENQQQQQHQLEKPSAKADLESTTGSELTTTSRPSSAAAANNDKSINNNKNSIVSPVLSSSSARGGRPQSANHINLNNTGSNLHHHHHGGSGGTGLPPRSPSRILSAGNQRRKEEEDEELQEKRQQSPKQDSSKKTTTPSAPTSQSPQQQQPTPKSILLNAQSSTGNSPVNVDGSGGTGEGSATVSGGTAKLPAVSEHHTFDDV